MMNMNVEKELPGFEPGNKENLNKQVDYRIQLNEKEVKNQQIGLIDKIPHELHKYDHWVVWKRGQGKNNKRPYNAKNLQPASVDNPKTWSSYKQARKAAEQGKADGVGFVLTTDDPYTFIDLDNVISDDHIDPFTEKLIKRFSSYTETSQSGRVK